jgi:AraC-like DNA-binding protein
VIQISKIVDKFFIDELIVSNYDLQLFIVEKGEGLIIVDSRVLNFLSNRIFFIPSHASFQIKGYVKSGYCLSIDQLLHTNFLLQNPSQLNSELFEYPKYYIDLDTNNAQNVFLNAERLKNELAANADFENLKRLFTSLLLAVKPQKLANEEGLNGKQHLMLELKGLIEKYYKEHRTIDFYAKQLNLQPQQLNLLCREITGKSVFEVISDRLIAEAEHLLLSSDLPIRVIAQEFGFAEQLHFSSYFKENRGITPIEFRNQ